MTIEIYEFRIFLRDILSAEIFKEEIKIKELLNSLETITSQNSLNFTDILNKIQYFKFTKEEIDSIGEYYQKRYSNSKNSRIKELLSLWEELSSQIKNLIIL